MSISAQQAAQQLKKDLANFLPDRYRPCCLSKRLAEDLRSYCLPETPGNFEDACIFFREFFAEISHPKVVSFGSSRGPIVFANILFAIKKIGERLRTFRKILIRTCEQYCQYEALFAVMCDSIHHPVGYFERFNSQNGRDFLLKGMMMVRIEQRRKFPPAPNCKLTYLFHFSLDEILGMMKRKHGMHDHADTRSHMEKSLRIYSYWNEHYSAPIRRLLQSKPNFFSDSKSELEVLYNYIMLHQTCTSFWLTIMQNMTCNFYRALGNVGIIHENKTWIIYCYICYREDHSSEPRQGQESFNDFMTRIVQPGQMAFPFKEHPRFFKTNSRFFRAALNWESVPTSDLLEICYRSHIKSQYGTVLSQCVLAASIRRKLYKVKIAKAAVKIQKFARRSLWQFYLKRLIAAMIIKKQVLRVVTPILRVIHAKVLISSAAKRIFIQEKFFERLKKYRNNQRLKAKDLIKQAFSRIKQRTEYIIQKTAATDLSRFLKVRSAAFVQKNLREFVKDLSYHDCPLCFEELYSVQIGVIQPCGHIHCKDCFDQIGTRCPCCRAKFMHIACKSVDKFLSQSNPKFFFTRENPEKKAAIAVIGGAIKRRLVDRI